MVLTSCYSLQFSMESSHTWYLLMREEQQAMIVFQKSLASVRNKAKKFTKQLASQVNPTRLIEPFRIPHKSLTLSMRPSKKFPR